MWDTQILGTITPRKAAIWLALGILGAFGIYVAAVATSLLDYWTRETIKYVKTEGFWEWALQVYLIIGMVLGCVIALVSFGWLWFWSASNARFWGFALGWAPSGLAAFVGGVATVFLWLPALVVGFIVLVANE